MGVFQAAPPRARCFVVKHIDAATVLRFIRPDLADEKKSEAIGSQLCRLVDKLGSRRFVLDFGGVGRVCSSLMGKLIAFERRVKKAGGSLMLCSLGPVLHSQFERTRLETVFPIRRNEEEALQGAGPPTRLFACNGCTGKPTSEIPERTS